MAVVAGTLANVAHAALEDATIATPEDIHQFVEQLGNEKYIVRQRAETRLLELGAEAFAQLQEAENHTDLEIAKRAKYILSQIRIEWTRPEDSAIVRSIMSRYGDLPAELRKQKVIQLAQLDEEQGLGALCRIARYDSSASVVRYAALAILKKGLLPKERTPAALALLTKEMGENQEAPLSWIQVYSDQLRSPAILDARWLPLVDAEVQQLDTELGESNELFAYELVSAYLNICDELMDAEGIFAGLQRQIELGMRVESSVRNQLIRAFTWIVEREHWETLQLLEDYYAEEIRQHRLLVYFVAWAREKQGRSDEADAMADAAFRYEGLDALERNQITGSLITYLGRHDWSEREWQAVIEMSEPTDLQSFSARQSMALLRLHDRLEHKAAADLLTETIDAINSDPIIKKEYLSKNNREDFNIFQANREFLLACHHESIGEYQQQRQHLEQAYRLDRMNADILIAMFHLQEASDVYRTRTRNRLTETKKQLERQIKQRSAARGRSQIDRWELAKDHNHWAWLVSNTEGDFEKAVQYSQRSLALVPDSPSYLDTLGRCYYAAGDLDNALKVQRQAVAQHPHMRVMQRQLKLFEDELQQRDAVSGEQ